MKISGEVVCPDCGEILYKRYNKVTSCWVYYCYRCDYVTSIYNKELEEEY